MGQTKDYLFALYRRARNTVREDSGTGQRPLLWLVLKVFLTAIGITSLVAVGINTGGGSSLEIALGIFASDILGLVILMIAQPFISVWRMPKMAASESTEVKKEIERLDKLLQIETARRSDIEGLALLYIEGKDLHEEGGRSRTKRDRTSRERWWREVISWGGQTYDYIEEKFGIMGIADFKDISTLESHLDGHENRMATLRSLLANLNKLRKEKQSEREAQRKSND